MIGGEHLWWYGFVAAFVMIAVAETYLPLRELRTSTSRRWTSNLVLFTISSAAVTLAFQVSAIALALTIRGGSHGLLNQARLPYFARYVVGFALLDLTAYLSHRFFHGFAATWRVHQVHHAETDLDLTTGFRFHPVEALVSRGLLLLTIALFGPPPGAVVLSGLAIAAQDFLQHANLRFPDAADRALRLLIVTPAMHRVHHSEDFARQNANFGTLFSLWDRMFGTYLEPRTAASGERCGLLELASGSELSARQLLVLPFRRTRGRAASAAAGTERV